ncbi:class A beta-lactamase [Enterovirga aerilata]|uniref:Beta-lactamase n=1 Tax=Enterovirga aerilata TaxID=2730920 RepID=A0A849I4J3_9HYPH|nr:class A beta-lactamase [Enterovirga sp. DB1703]NNM71299.1 class A beta-lactamase [Enterovirga sp. DB1703]
MQPRPTRRAALQGGMLVAIPLAAGPGRASSPRDAAAEIAAIEAGLGGRIGVAALDGGSRQRILHRADERFALTSTFKMLAAALVLARVDRGDEDLDRRILFGPDDLVTYSPVTKDRTHGQGMSLAELCEAAVVVSDNTAGNLLLASFGGPAGLTGYLRSLGDDLTRLDRTEPQLNEAAPGDPRDTTTPAAKLETMRRILIGDALAPHSRERLLRWMRASRTGAARLRAGLPKDWTAGDKTGSGGNGTANDVAVAVKPDGTPVLIASYMTGSKASTARLNEAHAAIGRLVAATFR